MKARRWAAILLVAVSVGAVAWSRGPAPVALAVAAADDAVAVAARAQSALVPGSPRSGEPLPLLAVLVGLSALAAPTGAFGRRTGSTPCRSEPGVSTARPRGPPVLAS